MTAATKTPDLTVSVDQIAQFGERVVEAGKHAGIVYLDGYDKFVEGVIAFQEKLAEQSQNEAIKNVVTSQVELTRQLTSAYTSAARKLLV